MNKIKQDKIYHIICKILVEKKHRKQDEAETMLCDHGLMIIKEKTHLTFYIYIYIYIYI